MASLLMRELKGRHAKSSAYKMSPFFSRAYGGYTKGQEQFYVQHLGSLAGQRIVDPMGGQGFATSALAWFGASVHIGDINPAVLLLAILRDPQLVMKWQSLRKWVLRRVSRLRQARGNHTPKYCDEWISPTKLEELELYLQVFNLTGLSNPFSDGGLFWHLSPEKRFAVCLPILAARDIACFRVSDNVTWLKKGGLEREPGIYGAITRALDDWCAYAQASIELYSTNSNSPGCLTASLMNAEVSNFGPSFSPTAIVTSPPYANRLDYAQMWGPELNTLCALYQGDAKAVKAEQIGSTVIRGRSWSDDDLSALPENIQDALQQIRNDRLSKASDSYYYPFFCNYAVSMKKALTAMAEQLNTHGKMIIFVRDTVRKDVLFPTGDLVQQILISIPNQPLALMEKQKHIIRNHIGLIRRQSTQAGIYGLAQQEWWLAFERIEL